jgi:hypothetical protein
MLGVDAKKLAEMLVNGNDKIQEYGKAINEEINRLEKEKNPSTGSGSAEPEGHKPDHIGHDHHN